MTVQTLTITHTPAALILLEQAILESPYYTDTAKETEIANLTTQLETNPQTACIVLENNLVLGVLVWSGLEAGLLWLSWIVTAPEARGRGVAMALLVQFHLFAKQNGVHKTWCDSRVGNTASKALLEKAGYTVATTLYRHWYGLDYLIWERLNPQ